MEGLPERGSVTSREEILQQYFTYPIGELEFETRDRTLYSCYTCTCCGSIVDAGDLDRHINWHKKMGG